MRVTTTLAQPPWEEPETHVRAALPAPPRTESERHRYLGSEAYAAPEQLTESRNQFSQYGHVEVLQTLGRQQHLLRRRAIVLASVHVCSPRIEASFNPGPPCRPNPPTCTCTHLQICHTTPVAKLTCSS